MKKIILLVSVLFPCSFAYSQSTQVLVNKIWQSTTGSPDTLDWTASDLDFQRNLIVVGNTITINQGTNLLVTKYSTGGGIIWQKTFNNTNNGNDYGIAVTTDASGNIFIAGASYRGPTNDYDYVILKYDSGGTKIWNTFYNGSGSSYDIPTAILLDGLGNSFVTGTSVQTGNLNDYLTAKLNSNGTILWTNNYDYSHLSDIPGALQIINNRLVVSGGSSSSLTNWDFATVKYNMSTGAQIAVNRNSSSGVGFDIVTAITKDAYSNFYVTGRAYQTNTGYDMKTVKLDTSLTVLWTKYNDLQQGEDGATDIEIDENNNIYVTGYGTYSNGHQDMITVKYNSSGTEQWKRNYSPLHPYTKAQAKKISISLYSAIYITGFENDGIQNDVVTLSYDLDGNIRWLRKWSGVVNGNDIPSFVKFDAINKKIFVTTRSWSGSQYQYVNFAYTEYTDITNPVVSDSGVIVYATHEVIVRFAPTAIIKSAVDDKEKQFGTMGDFVTSSVITQMNSKVKFQFNNLTAIKMFQRMISTDTISISRLGERIRIPDFWTVLLIKIPYEISEQEICDSLEKLFPSIRYAHLDFAVHPFTYPNDSLYDEQPNLHPTSNYGDTAGINMPLAWTLEVGKPFLRLGILDSGIDYTHEDFGNGTFAGSKIRGGWNYEQGIPLDPFDTEPDNFGHGTSVTGVAAAITNNLKGIAGIAGGDAALGNTGVSLYNLKVLDAPYFKYFIQSIYEGALDTTYSNGFGLHIMNLSWGFDTVLLYPQGILSLDTVNVMLDAIRFAFQSKVSIVCARGNGGVNNLEYPSCYRDDWLISVGGSDFDGDAYEGTNYGHQMDFIAPANPYGQVLTTLSHNSSADPYGAQGFSSIAAPQVTGVASLLISYLDSISSSSKNLCSEDIEHVIENTCTDENYTQIGNLIVGYDDLTGWGRVNAGKALQSVYKSKYKILHFQTSNYTLDTVDDNSFVILNYAYGSIQKGYHPAIIFKASATVPFSLPATDTILHSWVRNSSSSFFSNSNSQLDPEVNIYLDSVTLSSAYIYGYLYYLTDVNQWLPSIEDTMQLSFTLHTVDVTKSDWTTVNDIHPEDNFFIFPNPCTTQLNIQFNHFPMINLTLKITNMMGQSILEKKLIGQKESFIINTSSFADGIYILVLNNNTEKFTRKFIVQH